MARQGVGFAACVVSGSRRRQSAGANCFWRLQFVREITATFERKWEDNPTYHSYFPQKRDKHVEYTEGIYVGYRGYEKNHVNPQFPFGFGLSYFTFAYSELRIVPAAKASGEIMVPRPGKELKGFGRVNLKPGETKTVNVKLDRRAFSYYDERKHAWIAPAGEYGILVGSSSADIRWQGKYSLAQEVGVR